MEADLYVSGGESQPTLFGAGTLFFEAERVVSETPDLTRLPADLRERVTFDPQTNTLAVERQLTDRIGRRWNNALRHRKQGGLWKTSTACRMAGPSRGGYSGSPRPIPGAHAGNSGGRPA